MKSEGRLISGEVLCEQALHRVEDTRCAPEGFLQFLVAFEDAGTVLLQEKQAIFQDHAGVLSD